MLKDWKEWANPFSWQYLARGEELFAPPPMLLSQFPMRVFATIRGILSGLLHPHPDHYMILFIFQDNYRRKEKMTFFVRIEFKEFPKQHSPQNLNIPGRACHRMLLEKYIEVGQYWSCSQEHAYITYLFQNQWVVDGVKGRLYFETQIFGNTALVSSVDLC